MEKEVSIKGMYETTYSGGVFVGKLSTPTKMIGLTDQTKVALLEYLKESDEFHKLVCDIIGNVRKEVKPAKGYEELKADYLRVCDRYKKEQEKSNDLLRRWKDETAKRMKVQAALEDSHSHHNNVMNRIKDLLKEVDIPSMKIAIEALKAERAKGKLLAERYELSKNENDKLAKLLREIEGRYDKLKLNYEKGNEALQALRSTFRRMNDGKI